MADINDETVWYPAPTARHHRHAANKKAAYRHAATARAPKLVDREIQTIESSFAPRAEPEPAREPVVVAVKTEARARAGRDPAPRKKAVAVPARNVVPSAPAAVAASRGGSSSLWVAAVKAEPSAGAKREVGPGVAPTAAQAPAAASEPAPKSGKSKKRAAKKQRAASRPESPLDAMADAVRHADAAVHDAEHAMAQWSAGQQQQAEPVTDEQRLEWAQRAITFAADHSVRLGVERGRLVFTPHDARLHKRLRATFPTLNLRTLNPAQFADPNVKRQWANMLDEFQGQIPDLAENTLVRTCADHDYSDANMFVVSRGQFYALEAARNREGLNDTFVPDDDDGNENGGETAP
ncbi:hypothetical protein AMAG_04640 [Allomyces macrogynus ATCC 38327]|uniref:Polysaccharide biosynthesis domain-containing protein n=1 Tax=Allomyces macrogynus (strain ATCC 38327) TaxID=578462 RepID=A0A0L0S5Z4_ALLM3|nr:hypothetical protein AMAG_04640 [Allomyces macrogynus ATCC 38327]|eukprot:KNE57789.1 hypothetical protein AMAG_04640 [Allomyces macrogynus ATCC 38327]